MVEERPPFPFNMIEGMMPMFPLIAVMGWMIVLIAFVIGATALAASQATFFSDAKAIREGAAAGSAFVQANVDSHVIEAWLPQFKFLGLGLGLMAIIYGLYFIGPLTPWILVILGVVIGLVMAFVPRPWGRSRPPA